MTDTARAPDHVDTERARLVSDLRAKEAIARKAGNEASDARRALDAYDLARASTEGLTIETALLAYVAGRDNTLGLKYLRERVVGDWSKSFVTFGGSAWTGNGQFVASVGIPRDATPEEMTATSNAILELLPYFQPRAIDRPTRSHLRGAKILDIKDDSLGDDYATRHILGFESGTWRILDSHAFSREPKFEGSLDDCLAFIRDKLTYSDPPRCRVRKTEDVA